MTTNVWLTQEWTDENLRWVPSEYGEVDILYVPSEEIWLPDVVLFNNADGNYEVTLMTKASVRPSGRVLWEPPAVYKSSCTMNVEFFPFDEQLCSLKFGSWTYDATQVEIVHIHQRDSHLPGRKYADKSPTWSDTKSPIEKNISMDVKEDEVCIHRGIDLDDFYESVEWDLLAAPAVKKIHSIYNCCMIHSHRDHAGNCSRCCEEESCLLERSQFRPEITFNVTIRRKTLFHTVNLILPCVAISLLTVIVFHLPSDSGEKVALSISILLSLTVFFLLLAEIIPPTSLVVPLIGKFLLFTMLLVTCSIFVTVLVLNVHFRIPSLRVIEMGPCTRFIFLHLLPRILRVNVSRCFEKKNPLMPYNSSSCLNRTSTHECISSRPLMASLEQRGFSPSSFACKTTSVTGTENGHDIPEKESRVFNLDAEILPSGAKVVTPHNNFVKRNRFWQGGILDRNDLRGALEDKLQQLEERSSKSINETPNQQAGNQSQDGRMMSSSNDISKILQGQNERAENNSIHSHPEILKAFEGVHTIAERLRKEKEVKAILEDWKFVAMVMDRLFFWLFTAVCVSGGVVILLQAPSIYDSRVPLTQSTS